MPDSFWLDIFLILILILLNGFFSAAEFAIISTRRSRIKQLAEEGNKGALRVHKLRNEPERFLATIQVGITVVGALAGAVGGAAAIEIIKPLLQQAPFPFISRASEPIAIGIVVVIISYLTLIFGELVPKSLGLRYPERIAFFTAGAIDLLSRASSYLIKFLTFTTNIVMRPFGREKVLEPFVSEEEVKLIIREGRERGVFDQTEQELIHSIFEFTDTSVKDVMVPRPKIISIPISISAKEIFYVVSENRFSRYPVYRKNLDDIVGILNVKDLLEALKDEEEIRVSDILRPIYFVPETKKVSQLLKELQKRKMQMAIVLDEYGNVEGLITMEDLLEEIVGEIEDEYGAQESPVEKLENGSLVIDASLSIRDLRDQHSLPFPESEGYETLAGFMLHQLQRIPKGGEIIQHGDYKFTIVDMAERRIAKVKVERAKK
ncbi:MAG: hemolysin family protein [Nitrospirota bacterium]